MKQLNREDYQLITTLFKSTQKNLLSVLPKFLKQEKYKKVVATKQYIYAEGDIPIALVAHLDTVGKEPPYEIFYDREKGVMISPQLLGADDRAGIFSIIKIIKSGFKPHVIFTTDEEIGCIGAGELAKFPCPFKDIRYIIQLDRRNADDCVFYDCDNIKFEEYVEQFGFVTQWGSFTDICELCPAWGIAGVNLSIGYRDEHTKQEVLFIGQMFNTIKKVKKMLSEKNIPFFEYIPCVYSTKLDSYSGNIYDYYPGWDDEFNDMDYYFYGNKDSNLKYSNIIISCGICGKKADYYDMLEVKMIKGGKKFLCPDCLNANVEWCRRCGEAFQINPKAPNAIYCQDCGKEVIKDVHNSNRSN